MSNRNLRVNELLKREVSAFIHRALQAETVAVTIADVETSSDFKSATVFFSVIGGAEKSGEMQALLNRQAQAINQHLRRTITLRNIPRVRFQYDGSLERGSRIQEILDEINLEQENRSS